MNKEKILYQLSDIENKKAFPIEWNKLPTELLDNLSESDFYNNLAYKISNNKFTIKTVVYFQEVKRFGKAIKKYEQDNIIFGI